MKNVKNEYFITRFFEKTEPNIRKGMKLSTYFPKVIKTLLYSDNIPDDHFIICPLYREKKRLGSYIRIVYDFQIGITGSSNNDEEPFYALTRELKEEIGLYPASLGDLKNTISILEKGKSWTGYTLDIKNTSFVNLEFNDTKTQETVCENKVACIVHGPTPDIDKYINKDDIYRYYSADNIVGVVLLEACQARKYFKT